MPVQTIDDVRAGLDERRLEHEAEEREDAIEGFEIGLGLGLGSIGSGELAVGDAREKLGEDGEVEYEGGGEEGVFAFVEDVLRSAGILGRW